MVELLVKKGGNVERTNKKRQTALQFNSGVWNEQGCAVIARSRSKLRGG